MDITTLDKTKIPEHIAIIMDGNGRWAKQKNLPRISGHIEGVKTVRKIVEISSSLGVKILTLFTFSNENWDRPKKEVSSLMKLLISSLKKEINDLNNNNIKFNFIGDVKKIDDYVRDELDKAKGKTSHNTGMILNLALSYGSRQEIINAIKSIYFDYCNGKNINEIDEKVVSSYLYTSSMKDPDLLIRTGGDYRISNFLLWQIAYTEIIIHSKYWPDFSKLDFIDALSEFQSRERRFGRLNN